ncbi:MAG: hypothetical protein LKE85_07020 [Lachnospiraceae bacterium]|nr:hypothetical protein [Lachnospiraceae bacterium]
MIQESMDAMDELADSSTIAMFHSDAMMQDGFLSQGRIAIPIADPSMEAVYYVACMAQKKDRFRSFFSAVRAESLRAGSAER